MSERWIPVPGYEGLYEASDYGRIRSLDRYVSNAMHGQVIRRGRVLQLSPDKDGYLKVCLCRDLKKKSCFVAAVIAETFIGPRPDGLQVNHIDGVKLNNRPCNLEYVTNLENNRHAWRIGLRVPQYGEDTSGAKLTSEKVLEARNLRSSGMTYRAIAKRFAVNDETIRNLCTGRTWTLLENAI